MAIQYFENGNNLWMIARKILQNITNLFDGTESASVDVTGISAPLARSALLLPAELALEETNSTVTTGAAVDVTLNTSARLIEVTALDNPVFLKFGATASSADFDSSVNEGSTRHYIVPTGVTVFSYIAYAGTAHVLTTEFANAI